MRFIVPASLALVVVAATVPLQAGQSAAAQAPVTFAKDVAPILQKNCQTCHRPGSIAPMPLLTYDQARPWARSIKEQVLLRQMPPWFIDKNVGVQHFSNDRSLTDREIDTIARWVDAGAPQGNPADMPPPRQFAANETWQIGEPDVVVSLPKDLIVKAKQPDQWPDILVDPQLTQDRYIQGVQIIPIKGYPVIHHIRTSIVEPTDASRGSGQTDDVDDLELGEQGVFLNEYALGKGGDVFTDGSGRLIKAGTKINFQLHLHANGKEDMPANVKLGLKFYPAGYVPKHVIASMTVSSPQVDLRPHADNVRSDGYKVLVRPARILSFQPHMHNRGKAECLEAILPTGRVEVLSCAKFRFNWHLNYVYDDDAAPLLPAGTVLHAIMWHDNSAKNPFNNDPDAQITYGQRTVDEMSSAWLSWYYMSDEEYKQELAERRARRSAVTTSSN
ncbi:MAG: cytochrome c [Acidobacteria bacterium]|nr:cytochrome c [Acidobacteriota bacterium]